MMNYLLPCQHLTPAVYTQQVEEICRKILDALNDQNETHPGAVCNAVVEDVLDQVFVYHLKELASQVGPLEAQACLDGFIAKLKYHGQVALDRPRSR